MAISVYDQLILKPEDQEKIRYAQDMWQNSTTQTDKDSWHNYAESIRQGMGYSGDTSSNYGSGSGYTMTGFARPSLDAYESPYADKIDSALSGILDYDNFSYDPETDEAYQSFLGKVNRDAQTMFDDTIAGTSVGSGGRPNSWASTVASQSMGNMLLDGASKMPAFRDQAFNMFQSNRNYSIQQLEALMGLDETTYGRFMDTYKSEVDRYNMSIDEKATNISNAMERTRMTGYVSNSDAVVLGIPAGTPSYEAMERGWAMEDYLTKAKVDASYSSSGSGGRGSGGGGDSTKDSVNVKDAMTKTDIYNSLINQFGKNDNGSVGGKAEAKGEYLYNLYEQGYISKESMNMYAVQFGAKLPANATVEKSITTSLSDDPVVNSLVKNIKRAMSGGATQKTWELVKNMIDKKLASKEITQAQAEEALARVGF